MSHTAHVAFETSRDDKFDIHRSHNGADEYQLRQALEEYLSGKTDRSLNTTSGTEALSRIAKEISLTSNAETHQHDVVNPNPHTTNISKERICSSFSAWDTDVLYIVESDSIETYIPVTPSPAGIHTLPRAMKIELRQFDETSATTPKERQKEPADVTLQTLPDYSPKNLSDLPEWAQATLKYGHHHFIANMPTVKKNNNTMITLYDGVSVTQKLEGQITDLAPTVPAIPIKVPFDNNGNPEYPMIDISKVNIGITQPKAFTAKARYKLWPKFYKTITTTDSHDEAAKSGIKNGSALINLIVDQYGDKIDTDMLNDQQQRIIKKSREKTAE